MENDGSTFPKGFKWLNKNIYYTAGLAHDKRNGRGDNRAWNWLLYAWNC